MTFACVYYYNYFNLTKKKYYNNTRKESKSQSYTVKLKNTFRKN